MQRVILEMGQGVDLHGGDATKAAIRAVRDALGGSSLPLFAGLGLDPDVMEVIVSVAVPDPDAVDVDAVAQALPYGQVQVRAVPGGLRAPVGGDHALLAAASVEVFLPEQQGWRLSATTG
ncbi:MAG: Lin0512 family protein [Pseudomonadota bacterium]